MGGSVPGTTGMEPWHRGETRVGVRIPKRAIVKLLYKALEKAVQLLGGAEGTRASLGCGMA